MCKLFPVLWSLRTCRLTHLLRGALVSAVEHCAWTFVAELAAGFVLSREPREPFLPSNLPETRRSLMASQNSGPLERFQCAELSDHIREA